MWKTIQVGIPEKPKTRSKEDNIISHGRIQGHFEVPLSLTCGQDFCYRHNISSISKLVYVYARLEHESMKGKPELIKLLQIMGLG